MRLRERWGWRLRRGRLELRGRCALFYWEGGRELVWIRKEKDKKGVDWGGGGEGILERGIAEDCGDAEETDSGVVDC